MKRLLILLLIPLLWAMPVEAATTWDSYSDSNRTVVSNNFTASGAIVYMKGTGLQNNKTYRTTFKDASNNTVSIYDAQRHTGNSRRSGRCGGSRIMRVYFLEDEEKEMKTYLIQSQSLPAGKYNHSEARKWHEKLRVKLALWLLGTLKRSPLEIKTTSGVIE